jgi:hypothetical protein
MKTIVNKTLQPLRVPLPGGKVLHLGPKKTGQIADGAAEHPALVKLIEAGSIELQGEGSESSAADAAGGGEGGPGESTHGHAKSSVMHRRGQRGA